VAAQHVDAERGEAGEAVGVPRAQAVVHDADGRHDDVETETLVEQDLDLVVLPVRQTRSGATSDSAKDAKSATTMCACIRSVNR